MAKRDMSKQEMDDAAKRMMRGEKVPGFDGEPEPDEADVHEASEPPTQEHLDHAMNMISAAHGLLKQARGPKMKIAIDSIQTAIKAPKK